MRILLAFILIHLIHSVGMPSIVFIFFIYNFTLILSTDKKFQGPGMSIYLQAWHTCCDPAYDLTAPRKQWSVHLLQDSCCCNQTALGSS